MFARMKGRGTDRAASRLPAKGASLLPWGAESQMDDVGGTLSEQLSAAGRDLCKKLPVLPKKL